MRWHVYCVMQKPYKHHCKCSLSLKVPLQGGLSSSDGPSCQYNRYLKEQQNTTHNKAIIYCTPSLSTSVCSVCVCGGVVTDRGLQN